MLLISVKLSDGDLFMLRDMTLDLIPLSQGVFHAFFEIHTSVGGTTGWAGRRLYFGNYPKHIIACGPFLSATVPHS